MHEVEYIGGAPNRRGGDIGSAKLWLGLGALAVVMVVFMQWFRGDLFSTTMKSAPAAIANSEDVEGGQYSHFAMSSKALVRMRPASLDDEDRDDIARAFKESIVPLAVTRAERVRLAIVAGEVIAKEEALRLLDAVGPEIEAGSGLSSDVAWLKLLYTKGADSLSQEVQASLLDRHGWFGELALALGRPPGDSFRRDAVGGRERILSTFKMVGRSQVILFIVGIIVLGLMARSYYGLCVQGQFAEEVPDENLHAFVFFCIGFVLFLGFSMLPVGLGAEGSLGAAVAFELMSWLLLVVPAWPLIRGVSWSQLSRTVGFHTGQGVIVEAAIGVGAFLAWMPVTIGISEAIEALSHILGGSSAAGDPGGHAMFEAPPSDSGLLVFLSSMGAIVWAPLVEETIFRGFLFGWLRERLGPGLSIAITSFVFGIIHPYSPLGMIPVAAGGVLFGLLREMRGSLIAPMVAHALHNGLIVFMSLSLVNAIGG